MLLGALAFTISACTNSDNEPNYGEITLTTPVVQFADIQATASRGVAVTLTEGMKLNVELLKTNGTSTNRSAEYTFGTTWVCNAPLIVTGGAGDYHARVLASGVNVGDVKSAFYSFNGTIGVANDGTFTIGKDDDNAQNDMQPLTAAIKVVLKNANGEVIADTDLEAYSVKMTGLQKVTSVAWNNSNVTLNAVNIDTDDAKSNIYGYYMPKTIDADADLLTVTHTENSTDPATTTTWNVKNDSNPLTIAAGTLYTFTITLGGNSSLSIEMGTTGSGNGISGFEGASGSGSGNNIDINRKPFN